MRGKRGLEVGAVGLTRKFSARGPGLTDSAFGRSSQTQGAERHLHHAGAFKLRFKLLDDLRSKFRVLAGQIFQNLPRVSQLLTVEDDVKFIRGLSQPAARAFFELSLLRIGT